MRDWARLTTVLLLILLGCSLLASTSALARPSLLAVAPTVLTPIEGASFPANSVIPITWNRNGADARTAYRVEYSATCRDNRDFFDDVERGVNGWSVGHSVGNDDWEISVLRSHSPGQSWYAPGQSFVNNLYLVSPPFVVPAGADLSFWHLYDFEYGYDGGVVEIRPEGATLWDDLDLYMFDNGYTDIIQGGTGSPIANRRAFTGASPDWVETRANLRAYAGLTVRLRFRATSDSSVASYGWHIDDVFVQGEQWQPITVTQAGASGYDWLASVPAGDQYCVRVRAERLDYDPSPWSVSGIFRVTAGGPTVTPTPTLTQTTAPRTPTLTATPSATTAPRTPTLTATPSATTAPRTPTLTATATASATTAPRTPTLTATPSATTAPRTPTLTTTPSATTALPTSTLTVTETATRGPLPDLVITYAYVRMQGYSGGCISAYTPLVTEVGVRNQGAGPAGPFTVRADGYGGPPIEWRVEGLAAGAEQRLTREASASGNVVVDVNNEVVESDETNNRGFVAIPTAPALCTTTPTPTATPTGLPVLAPALWLPYIARAVPPPTPPPGSLTGRVVNAVNAQPLAGVTVSVLGTGLTTTTDAEGEYHLEDVPSGLRQVTASLTGFVTSTQQVTIERERDNVLNFSLSPNLAEGEMRIVLEWGAQPADLDSHLWLPPDQPYHIYFANQGTVDAFPFAALDVDDTTSFGPETVTIRQRLPGSYLYAIYNYRNEAPMSVSNARVTVYAGNAQIARYAFPGGAGRWWTVMRIDGATGQLTPVNTVNDTCPGYSCEGEN